MSTYKAQKQGANTLQAALGPDDNMILEYIRLEVEARDSDFIRLDARGHLESSFIKVWLDRGSIVDSLMAKDIT